MLIYITILYGDFMKKKRYIELKIYELLGVKQFKKFVIGLIDTICTPFVFDVPKDKRKDKIHSSVFNYYMGNIKDFTKIKKFKKWLIFNAALHIRALWNLTPNFAEIIVGDATTSTIVITSVATVINLYCVMLQRYNWVRIKKATQTIKPYYEKEKNSLIDELQKECLSLGEKSYRIMNARIVKPTGWKEITSFDELVSTSSLNDLRLYRDRLKAYKQDIEDREHYIGLYYNDDIEDTNESLNDNKVLKYPNKQLDN